MSRPLITVFGATGGAGGGLVRTLLAAAAPGTREFRVRVATRHPGSAAAQALSALGAEVCAVDLDDAASVDRALAGAYGAFCHAPYGEHRSAARLLGLADTMARAAQRAGLQHVLWSTLEDTRRYVEPDGRTMPLLQQHCNVPHFDARGQADACFVGRGLPVTRLLAGPPWERLVDAGLLRRDADGTLALWLPLGDARLPGIAAADIGACAAALLRRPQAAIGRRIGLAGEHLGAPAMAAELAHALGEPVRHHDALPPAADGADELANLLAFARRFHAELCQRRDPAAARALHPGLQDFAAWARAHADRLRRLGRA